MSAARLEQMKKYLAEAEKSPEENKLYIEDLKLSIKNFDSMFRRQMEVYKIGAGFVSHDKYS